MKNPKLRRIKKQAPGPKNPRRFTDWDETTVRVTKKPKE